MEEVSVAPGTIASFREVLSAEATRRTQTQLARAQALLDGRTIWHVNSTGNGGGVAELLRSVLPYARGAGIDARWLVIGASDGFLEITKRLHHRLHERPGDGGPLGDDERRVYERDLDRDRAELRERITPGDVVVLHDPQTAGLAPMLRRYGARVIWRCHIGVDSPGPCAREAWTFLGDDVRDAELWVFSRASYAWDTLDPARVVVLPPCIDVLSPKNRRLTPDESQALFEASGVDLPADQPFVLQVSRWDPLKDHEGVLCSFVELCRTDGVGAHLVLAGPETDGVDDDPEGEATLEHVQELWAAQSPPMRQRIHLASLSMDDAEKNALTVNALQRRAEVVVQKSIAEGFGLTVAEAMWKERPVVASRVGGIQDQIVHGESGLLLDDPTDTYELARDLALLLERPEYREQLGAAAHGRVADHFLPLHHFEREAALLERLLL